MGSMLKSVVLGRFGVVVSKTTALAYGQGDPCPMGKSQYGKVTVLLWGWWKFDCVTGAFFAGFPTALLNTLHVGLSGGVSHRHEHTLYHRT